MPKKSDFFWLSWHFEIIKISLCEGHHIWESVNSNAMLAEHNFFRVNKSTLLNLNKIESLKSDIDRRIRVTLKNGYQLIISRAYAEEFKTKIGVR